MVTFANLGSVRLPYLLTYLPTKFEVRRPSRSEDTAQLKNKKELKINREA